MSSRELHAEDLYSHCDVSRFSFETTSDLEGLTDMLGQPRAVEAVRFGIEIQGDGYNIYALGTPGTGKRTLVLDFLNRRAPAEATPDDWCYVNNFEEPQKPRTLRLPPGKGPELQYDMEQLVEDVRRVLPSAFESEEYRQWRQALEETAFAEQQEDFDHVHQKADEEGLQVAWTPTGLVFTPTREGKPMPPDEVDRLPDEERERLRKMAEELQKEILDIMQRAPRAQRAARQKLKELNRDVARQAFEPLIDELRTKYEALPKVVEYLDAVKGDLMENAERLIDLHGSPKESPEEGAVPVSPRALESALLRAYQVNVLVTRSNGGAPVIYEDNPTHQNLLGRIEQIAHMGTLFTDFMLIRAGTLLQANGGYLVLEVQKILMSPYAWEGLKRALRSREVKIENLGETLGLISTVSLNPEPVPLKLKVVLLGTRMLYYLLSEYDPEFAELVKVPADFATDMDRNEENDELYARLIAGLVEDSGLRPFDKHAVARVIEHGSRVTGDSKKLSVHLRGIMDLLREAEHRSKENGQEVVKAEDVQRAIDAHIYRSSRMQERMREMTERGVILIDTGGAKVGQVNGLAVFPFGDVLYGQPSRITARTRMGDGHVIDIEREVELGGALHSKGVLILQGYLSGRYAKDMLLSLSASLVFEQSYGEIGGDSASSAELYALLSSIAEAPIRQSLAVTGSVNQHGEVQAIGAVNEKIEGFFDLCNARGLSGDQGVLIPASNVQHLMLRRDVIDAVEAGRFHIHAVETIDQGLELLTGVPAGEPDEEGNYPEDSLNGRIFTRLKDLAEERRKFGRDLEEHEEGGSGES